MPRSNIYKENTLSLSPNIRVMVMPEKAKAKAIFPKNKHPGVLGGSVS